VNGPRKRKLWAATFIQVPGHITRFESKAQTYRWICGQAADWRCGALQSPLIEIHVDERDGRGYQLYEKIDLRKL
jgi:hypothetical protein